MGQFSHGRPVPATPTRVPIPWHARKDPIVLQLIDLLSSFSLVEVFGAFADRILHWEN